MKFIKKFLWFLLFLWLIIVFLPKTNLFYLAEEHLKEYKVILNNEKTEDILGYFGIQDAEIYYEGIHVGDIDNIGMIPAIFYNSISISNANFADSMKQFIPKKIESLHVWYTPFYPIMVFISSRGDYGEISGNYSVMKKRLTIILQPAKDFVQNYPAIASQFKKQEGKYIYETTFK